MVACPTSPQDRRRVFWTTQTDTNGTTEECNTRACGLPGITLEDGEFLTTDYVRSLIINMMMTDGREPDKACGYRPGSLGGHWSESFIDENDAAIGTLIRTVEPQGSTQDVINLLQAYAEATLARLVTRGVAVNVAANVRYISSGRYAVDVEVQGIGGTSTKIGLSTTRNAQGWVWET